MDSKVNVKGDVDVVMDQNLGSITVNNYYGDNKVVPAIKPELRRAIHELLLICDACNQRKLIEKIAKELYGSTDFRSLTVVDVRKLAAIAKETAALAAPATVANDSVVVVAKARWWKFWISK
jgi:hypothetical protein